MALRLELLQRSRAQGSARGQTASLDPRACPIALRVCSCTPVWLILGDPLPLGALDGSPPPTPCSAGLSPSGFGSSLGPGRQQRAVLWVNPNFPTPQSSVLSSQAHIPERGKRRKSPAPLRSEDTCVCGSRSPGPVSFPVSLMALRGHGLQVSSWLLTARVFAGFSFFPSRTGSDLGASISRGARLGGDRRGVGPGNGSWGRLQDREGLGHPSEAQRPDFHALCPAEGSRSCLTSRPNGDLQGSAWSLSSLHFRAKAEHQQRL